MRIARPHYYFLWVRFGAMDRNSSLAFGSPLLHSSCSLYTTTENEKKKTPRRPPAGAHSTDHWFLLTSHVSFSRTLHCCRLVLLVMIHDCRHSTGTGLLTRSQLTGARRP
jgi:hypothetical protein